MGNEEIISTGSRRPGEHTAEADAGLSRYFK